MDDVIRKYINEMVNSEEFYFCYEKGGDRIHCGSAALFDRMMRDHHRNVTRQSDPNSEARFKEKIFGIGLIKTGTISLAKAMQDLGYIVYHDPLFINIVYDVDFCNDFMVAGRFQFLDEVFPNAKFILTVRDIDSWIVSVEKWWKDLEEGELKLYEDGTRRRTGVNMAYDPLSSAYNRYLLFHSLTFDKDNYIKCYYEHIDEVLDHFKGREDKLLVMDICDGDGWDELCPFVGKDIPNISFPHLNKSIG